MEAYQQRVVDELNELSERRAKLDAFIAQNPAFGKLPEDERRRMNGQLFVMGQYAKILQERIQHFSGQKVAV